MSDVEPVYPIEQIEALEITKTRVTEPPSPQPPEENPESLIEAAVSFLKPLMEENDPSRDWFHIQRVLRNAKMIAGQKQAKDLSLKLNDLLITLGAMFHDYGDRKYVKPGVDPLSTLR